jgi:hypothetical protein
MAGVDGLCLFCCRSKSLRADGQWGRWLPNEPQPQVVIGSYMGYVGWLAITVTGDRTKPYREL